MLGVLMLFGSIGCHIYLKAKQTKLKSLTEDLKHIEHSYKNGHQGERKSI